MNKLFVARAVMRPPWFAIGLVTLACSALLALLLARQEPVAEAEAPGDAGVPDGRACGAQGALPGDYERDDAQRSGDSGPP